MVHFRHGLISLAFCIVLRAEPSQAGDVAAAEALFRSAREAAEAGDWVAACDRFEESKRLEAAPGTVLNLARCREKLGQIASAWKSYVEAAQRLPTTDERAAFAQHKALQLAERVPHLVLVAPDFDKDITVVVRGTRFARATFGVPLPFDPGLLSVVVQADGREDRVAEVTLAEGENREFRLELGPPLGRQSSKVSSDAVGRDLGKSTNYRRTFGFSLLGVGSVGVLASVGGAIWSAKELKVVNDEDNCRADRCNKEGAEAADRGKTAVAVMATGSALAVIGLGLGSYFLLTPSEDTTVAFSPVLGGGLLSFSHRL